MKEAEKSCVEFVRNATISADDAKTVLESRLATTSLMWRLERKTGVYVLHQWFRDVYNPSVGEWRKVPFETEFDEDQP